MVASSRLCARRLPTVNMSAPELPAPGPHPRPPDDIMRRALPLVERSGPWLRMHHAASDPVHFGRSGAGRFDAPEHDFGVLYMADDAHGAFIETFGRRTGINYVAYDELFQRRLTQITSSRPLRVVDLTGSGLAQLGADARLTTGEHRAAQAWATVLRAHPQTPDGVLYRARHDPSRACMAVFDAIRPVLTARSLGALTDEAQLELLADIIATYGFGLITSAR